jgi:Hsp20/alpha crystallin family
MNLMAEEFVERTLPEEVSEGSTWFWSSDYRPYGKGVIHGHGLAVPNIYRATSFPLIEVGELSGNLVVTAELPGVEHDDVGIELNEDGFLTIAGQRRPPEQLQKIEYSERSYGPFRRKIPLWESVKIDEAPSGILYDAEFNDPTEIPARMKDRQLNRSFETSDADVLVVLKPVA